MAREITYRLFVIIDGVSVPWNDLPPDRKKKIATELNDRAMRSIGYRPVEEKNTQGTA